MTQSALKNFIRAYLLCSLMAGTAVAAVEDWPLLPYSTRTRSYSGLSNSLRGDLRTIGMAGAMVGLGDTYFAAADNPAGLAMTLPGTSVQVTGNTIYDSDVQGFDNAIYSANTGTAWVHYPYGFAISYSSPQTEGQIYRLNGSPHLFEPEVVVKELRISAARVMLRHRLSLGMGLIFGQANQRLSALDPETFQVVSADARTSYTLSADFGLMYQFPKRWLAGIHYNMPINYPAPSDASSATIPGFYQSVKTPYRLGMGVGWIPNRFFAFGATLYFTGASPEAALLSDDNRIIGRTLNIQPRIGASYLVAEYKHLTIEVHAGSYIQTPRIEGANTRLHFTTGIDLSPWLFKLGWGIDRSSGYKNYMYSAGIDVIKIMRKLDLIPTNWHPPCAGLLPRPFLASDEDLPRPLVKNWVDRHNPNIIEITKKFPERLQRRFEKTGRQIGDFSEDVVDAIESVPTTLKTGAEKILTNDEVDTSQKKKKPSTKKTH